MSDLRDLYQETILDHSRHPKNFGVVEPATHRAEGYNPLCGDKVEVTLQLDGDRVAAIKFRGQGCAISTASASLMTEALRGKTVSQALALFRKLHETVTGQSPDANARSARGGASSAGHAAGARVETGHSDPASGEIELGKLSVLEGVKQYPLRVKCATLAWHALRNALTGHDADLAVTE